MVTSRPYSSATLALALALCGTVAGCGSSSSARKVQPADAGDAATGEPVSGTGGAATGTGGKNGTGGQPGTGGKNTVVDAGTGDTSSGGRDRSAELDASQMDDAAVTDAAVTDARIDCDGGAVGSRIVMAFGSANPEVVTNLQWLDSDSTLTPNLAASGGPLTCTDPIEFFGEAYGGEGTLPAPVVAGGLGTLDRCGLDARITSAPADCAGASQFPVTTRYRAYAGVRASELRVSRTFGFGADAAVYPQTILRAFVPRVPLGTFSSVIYPVQGGPTVSIASPGSCAVDCLVPIGTTWSGRWFADIDPNSGLALIVLRDPSLTSPVSLAVNNDGYSSSNLTSFQLLAPTGGWKEPVTEVEYLCFADLKSWPQTERDAARLPAGCGP
jgi:hypothetical protein